MLHTPANNQYVYETVVKDMWHRAAQTVLNWPALLALLTCPSPLVNTCTLLSAANTSVFLPLLTGFVKSSNPLSMLSCWLPICHITLSIWQPWQGISLKRLYVWWSMPYSLCYRFAITLFHGFYDNVLLCFVQINSEVTSQCAGRVIPAAMSLFLKYSHGKAVWQGCWLKCKNLPNHRPRY